MIFPILNFVRVKKMITKIGSVLDADLEARTSTEVGVAVKAYVQVQSNSITGVVKELSYQARGPFQIEFVKGLGQNSFEVRRYN